jgi:hypothetical protein
MRAFVIVIELAYRTYRADRNSIYSDIKLALRNARKEFWVDLQLRI